MAIARRTKADLIAEIKLHYPKYVEDDAALQVMSKKQLSVILAARLAPSDSLQQIEVMLAAPSEEYMDMSAQYPWYSGQMLPIWGCQATRVEQKMNGIRAKLHFTRVKGQPVVRLDGRNQSTKTFTFHEFTTNLPQFPLWPHWQKELFAEGSDGIGTILDGELLMPVESLWSGKTQTDSELYSSLVVVNSSPEVAIAVQRANGWCRFHLFDVLMHRGEWQVYKPLVDRLALLEQIRQANPHPAFDEVPFISHDSSVEAKVKFYLAIVGAGGEGVILKDIHAKYETGKRRESWLKVKKFKVIDCFVTGYRPGESGFEGMVGAVEGAVLKGGEQFGICAVSGFTLEERKSMTAEDGSLTREYYDKVMEIRFQEESKTGRGMHARFVRWRPDKNKSDCTM